MVIVVLGVAAVVVADILMVAAAVTVVLGVAVMYHCSCSSFSNDGSTS